MSLRSRLCPEGERPSWEELLRRVFSVKGLIYPGCGGPLRLRTVVVNPVVARHILSGLRRATAPPVPRGEGESWMA